MGFFPRSYSPFFTKYFALLYSFSLLSFWLGVNHHGQPRICHATTAPARWLPTTPARWLPTTPARWLPTAPTSPTGRPNATRTTTRSVNTKSHLSRSAYKDSPLLKIKRDFYTDKTTVYLEMLPWSLHINSRGGKIVNRQLTMQPMMKIESKWHFCVCVSHIW